MSDDLTGLEADGVATVRFGLQGLEYEIDLEPANRNRLSEVLKPFIEKARLIQPEPAVSLRHSDASEIRKWARSNGIEVPARGRIPGEVRRAFNERPWPTS